MLDIKFKNICPSCGMKINDKDLIKIKPAKFYNFEPNFLGNQYKYYAVAKCPNSRCQDSLVCGLKLKPNGTLYIGAVFTFKSLGRASKVKESQTLIEKEFSLPEYIEQKARGLSQKIRRATSSDNKSHADA